MRTREREREKNPTRLGFSSRVLCLESIAIESIASLFPEDKFLKDDIYRKKKKLIPRERKKLRRVSVVNKRERETVSSKKINSKNRTFSLVAKKNDNNYRTEWVFSYSFLSIRLSFFFFTGVGKTFCIYFRRTPSFSIVITTYIYRHTHTHTYTQSLFFLRVLLIALLTHQPVRQTCIVRTLACER